MFLQGNVHIICVPCFRGVEYFNLQQCWYILFSRCGWDLPLSFFVVAEKPFTKTKWIQQRSASTKKGKTKKLSMLEGGDGVVHETSPCFYLSILYFVRFGAMNCIHFALILHLITSSLYKFQGNIWSLSKTMDTR